MDDKSSQIDLFIFITEMEAKFVTGRDEFPLDFYTSIFVRDAALVCATLIEGGGGNDLDWNKMSPLCNILKSNLALGGLRVQHYSKYRIFFNL